MSYADANFTITREAIFTTTAGATTEGAKFRSFQRAKLKKVHAAVLVAGTNAGHGYDEFDVQPDAIETN